LRNYNEQWIEEGEDESIKKARKEALNLKKPRLETIVRELVEKLTEKEIQSI